MRGRHCMVEWHEEDTIEGLKAAYQRERDIELRTRLHGLWLVRSGQRLRSVAETLGVHDRTVQTWVAWYRAGGLANVLSHKMGGKGQEPFLSPEAQEHVAQEVSTGRFRTTGEVRDWAARQYGVTYTVGGMYSLLRRLRCSPKVPRPIHVKADQEQQESWKKRGLKDALAQIEATLTTVIGFADEMRLGLRGTTRRVWGRRGVKIRQPLQLVYEWRYLFLAVDALGGRVHWTWIESMKAELVDAALNGLKLGTDVGTVVWDGAPSHWKESVHTVGMPLVRLPPYSPELNPAERVFEEVRRWVEGKVYRSIEEKMAAVDSFLSELDADPERVRALTCWTWIDQAIKDLPTQIAA